MDKRSSHCAPPDGGVALDFCVRSAGARCGWLGGWACAMLVLGCTGQIQEGVVVGAETAKVPGSTVLPTEPKRDLGGDSPASLPTPGGLLAPPSRAECVSAPASLRLLSGREYDASVAALTGTRLQPGRKFPAREVPGGFDNDARAARVSPVLLERYVLAAISLGDDVAERFNQVTGCAVSTAKEPMRACAEVAQLTETAASSGILEGARSVSSAIFAPPRFFYRIENRLGVSSQGRGLLERA